MDKDEIKALFLMKFRIDHPKTLEQRVKERQEKEKIRKNKKKKYREIVRVCKFCGKEFTPTSFINVYCCEGCRIAWYSKQARDKAKNKPKETHFCEFCGKRFKTKNSRKKYCRPLCAYYALMRMSKEYQRRKRNERKNYEIDRQVAC